MVSDRLKKFEEDLANENRVPMITDLGKMATIDISEYHTSVERYGWRAASEDDIINFKNQVAWGDSPITTGAAGAFGAARGLTFGLSDPLLTNVQGVAGATAGAIGDAARWAGASEETIKTWGLDTDFATEKEWARNILSRLQEFNPKASLGGEVVGAIAPAVFTAGESLAVTAASGAARGSAGLATRAAMQGGKLALAREAARGLPASMASQIGRATERKIVELAAKAGRKGVATQIVAKAGAGAVEGGLYGAGSGVSRLALDENPLTPEAIISEIGLGAVTGVGLGAGAGAAFGLAGAGAVQMGKGARAAVNKIMKSAEDSAITPLLKENIKKSYAKLASLRTGMAQDDIRKVFTKPGMSADDLRRAVPGIDDAEKISQSIVNMKDHHFNDVVTAFTKHVEKHGKSADDFVSEMYNLYKEGDVFEFMINSQANRDMVELEAKDLIRLTNTKIAQMESRPTLYTYNKGIDMLRQINAQFERDLIGAMKQPHASRPSDLFKILDGAKKEIDNISKWGKELSPMDRPTVGIIRDIRSEYKKLLTDPQVFGRYGEGISYLNTAYNEYRVANDALKKAFGRKIATKTGQVKYIMEPSKIKTFLKNPADVRNTYKEQVLFQWAEAVHNLSANSAEATKLSLGTMKETVDIARVFNNPSTAIKDATAVAMRGISSIKKLNDIVDQSGQSINDMSNLMMLVDQYQVVRAVSRGGKTTVDPLTLIAAGGSFVNPGLGLWEAGVAAAQIGKNPALDAAMLNTAQTIVNGSRKLVSSAVKGLTKKAQLGIDGTVGSIAITSYAMGKMRAEDKKISKKATLEQRHDKLVNHLDRLASNPGELEDSIENRLAPIGVLLPGAYDSFRAKAHEAIQYLQSVKPEKIQVDKLRPNVFIGPTPSQMISFERQVAVATNPSVFFRDMKNGIVHPESAKVIKHLYPSLYTLLMSDIIELLNSGDLPYQTRQKLMFAFNLTDDNIEMYQQVYLSEKEVMEQANKLRRGTMTDMVDRQETGADRTRK